MVLLLFYLLSLSAGESKSKATRLKLVLNALWEVRADWERIADQLISPGSREVNFKYLPWRQLVCQFSFESLQAMHQN